MGPLFERHYNPLDPAISMWDTAALIALPRLFRPEIRGQTSVEATIDALTRTLERSGVEYEQPPGRELPSQLEPSLPKSWLAQAEWQHLWSYMRALKIAEELDVEALLERPAGTDHGPLAQ